MHEFLLHDQKVTGNTLARMKLTFVVVIAEVVVTVVALAFFFSP